MTPLASLSFERLETWPFVLPAAAILVVLSVMAWRRQATASPSSVAALSLRLLGIALLLLSLLDPRWSTQRASKGANIVALVADNSLGMQLQENASGLSRGDLLRQRLEPEQAAWLDELQESFQTRAYLFDRKLKRIDSFNALDFQGQSSELRAALQQVEQRYRGLPLAGVVLLTDGNATDLTLDDLPELTGLPAIYPVVVGSSNPLPDIRVSQLTASQSPFDDAPVTLKATIAHSPGLSSPVEVSVQRLRDSQSIGNESGTDEMPAPVTLEPSSSAASLEAEFQWRSFQSGLQFYEVAAKRKTPSPDFSEATLLNNRRLAVVDRGKSAFRILYVSGRPNWEYKFLNRSLLQDPQLQMVGLIRIAKREPKFEFKGRAGESSNPLFRGFDRVEEEIERYDKPVLVRVNTRDQDELADGFPSAEEELFAYDALILDDVEAEFFTYSQQTLIRRFVSDRGGGLLALGGAETLHSGGYQATPLADVLPVYLDRAPQHPNVPELSWSLTREGWVEPWARLRPTEEMERDRLARLPAFRVLNPFDHIKPGARALATVQDPQGNRYPSLVAQNFGYGRAACIAVGDIWRWGMQGPEENADLARFWRQISRWLVTDAPQRVELVAKPAPNGETELRVTVRDQQFRPMDLASLRVSVRQIARLAEEAHPGGEPTERPGIVFRPEAVPNQPGQYIAHVPYQESGAYLAKVEATDPQGLPLGSDEAGWIIDAASSEFSRLNPNRQLLQALARQTGGAMLELDELGQLADTLQRNPSPIMETRSVPIWHRQWFFLAALGCLLAEWALRRRKGLA